MSRGAREGNNALIKDLDGVSSSNSLAEKMMMWNTPIAIVNIIYDAGKATKESLANAAVFAVRYGHWELAEYFLYKEEKSGGLLGLISHFHHEALLPDGQKKWQQPPKSVSVLKRGPRGMTPLHCASANPDLGPLKVLFKISPDLNVADDDRYKLVHYAAGAESLAPLKFLVEKGASLDDANTHGWTPMFVAARAGRAKNVEYILATLKAKGLDDDEMLEKIGPGGVNRQDCFQWTALHYAADLGFLDVVKVLVEGGADVEKPLNIDNEKRTPLMLAAGKGHLDVVEYLSQTAKMSAGDRLKRTALTHAVMNGATNVAGFFLNKGLAPDKADSSGNTNLHYACAYGWYYCVKTLVDAGADVNVANEWKLTPVTVAMLKGHHGISKYLSTLPGVDLNVKDDLGQTVLLSMLAKISTSNPLTRDFVDEIKDMVENRGADPKVVDNDGKNALHIICSYNPVPNRGSFSYGMSVNDIKKLYEDLPKQKMLLQELVSFLVTKTNGSLDTDSSGYLPIDYAIQCYEDPLMRKNYEVLLALLDNMQKEVAANPDKKVDFTVENQHVTSSTLRRLVEGISVLGVKSEIEVYRKLKDVFQTLDGRGGLEPELTTMLEPTNRYSTNESTLVYKLCETYSKVSWIVDSSPANVALTVDPDLVFDDNGRLEGMADIMDTFRSLIFEFIDDLKPVLVFNYFWQRRRPDGETEDDFVSSQSVLMPLANVNWERTKDSNAEPFGVFKAMLKHTSNVEFLDNQKRTPIIGFIEAGKADVLKAFIDAGADVNCSYKQGSTYARRMVLQEDGTYTEKSDRSQINLSSSPLNTAIRKADLNLVKILLDAGADVKAPGPFTEDEDGIKYYNYTLFAAVNSCIANRNDKTRVEILSLLLKSGLDINVKDVFYNRGAAHIAADSASNKVDQNLDLEITLLRAGADVLGKDYLGRTPLHYCFAKIASNWFKQKSDPMEVCSMLVEAMDGKGVDDRDAFGCSPLHYAAYRGATVCSLLLLEHGATLDAVDNKGNTPLGYSVLGNHESCAIALLQKGAKLDIKINQNLTIEEAADADAEEMFDLQEFNFIPTHYNKTTTKALPQISLFQGIVQNNWLGVTYMVLKQLEGHGMSYAKAIEVALVMKMLQFAKTLIGRQVMLPKLKVTVSNGRTLIGCLAHECHPNTSPHVQVEILKMLVAVGVSPAATDTQSTSPIHSAALRHNLSLVKALLEETVDVDRSNNFDLTPLTAVFWNYETGHVMRECAKALIEKGADPNTEMPFKEFSYLQGGCVARDKSLKEFADMPSERFWLTPLILAVIHRDADMIELLVKSEKTDVNRKDPKGMTPLMHAVKTNDVQMVLRLLHKEGDVPRDPRSGKVSTMRKVMDMDADDLNTSGIRVNDEDANGFTALHHLVELSESSDEVRVTFDNEEMLELLLLIGADPAATTKDGKTALEMAEDAGAMAIVEHLSSVLERDARPAPAFSAPTVDDGMAWEDEFEYDVIEDAHKMLRILEEKADKKAKEKMDGSEIRNEENSKPRGCRAGKDAAVHGEHTVLLQRIDLSHGVYGCYNFYRMQVRS